MLVSHSEEDACNQSQRDLVVEAIQSNPAKAMELAKENLSLNLAEIPESHLQFWQELVEETQIEKIVEILRNPKPEEESLSAAHPFGGILT